jgi:peptidoglycan/xylan/chitin deacetylase (PgdA/CDA1 family)
MTPADRLHEDELAIFLFHGVVERSDYEVRNYTHKHLTREVFVDVMEHLTARGRPLSIADVVAHCANAEPFPPCSFAVTFDDGFENNHAIAAPVLSDLGVPATFYVTTAFIDQNAMSWTDRLEYFMEHTARGALRLPWAEGEQAFGDRDSKIGLLEQIRHRVKTDPAIDVDALVADIFAQEGRPELTFSDDPLDRKMSWDQVAELAGHELFTVGGHGHTHRILSFLNDEALTGDVWDCLRLLAEKASVGPEHYSYPEGLDHCYSDRVIDVLRQRGIVCCPTARDGTNPLTEGLFALRRIAVVQDCRDA